MTRQRHEAAWIALVLGQILAGCVRHAGPSAEVPAAVNAVGMVFQFIPGGSFQMGSMTGQPDERPVHRVTLDPFYMGAHEVTQAQYEAVMGGNPSRFRGPSLPVESVTWHEAAAFCDRLSDLEGRAYRLPTEAEWEYAARGGVEGREFAWGDEASPEVNGLKHANVADEAFRAAYARAADESGSIAGYHDGYAATSPVGRFAPNGYGLRDMIGNVFEWCSDYYVLGTQYYAESPEKGPRGPALGEERVLRGASWWAAPERYYRVASRFRDAPDSRAAAIGFRCVREVASRTGQ